MKTIHNFDTKYINLYGLPYGDRHRLNLDLKEQILLENKHLIELGQHLSGAHMAFKTTAKSINFYVELARISVHPHMTNLAESGLDIYLKHNNEWVFYRSIMPISCKKEYEQTIEFFDNRLKEIIVYFPLYNEIIDFKINIDDDQMIEPLDLNYKKQGLVYGTSITQGACASRSGLSYTSIISRKLNHHIFNYGFSGQGLGEPIMATMIASIPNLDYIVIDYEANAGAVNRLKQSLPMLIETIRKSYIDIPIFIITRVKTALSFFDGKIEEKRNHLLNFQKTLIKNLNDENLYIIDGSKIFKESIDDYTVDGIHFNDLGFHIFVKYIIDKIDKTLKLKG
jgi:hypothetical protein